MVLTFRVVTSRGIMIVQQAYDLLVEEQQEGESYSECIIRLIEELRSCRDISREASSVEEIVLNYIEDIEHIESVDDNMTDSSTKISEE